VAERHQVVVDGSNLATEGRTLPSLAQLDEAVRAYLEEDPEAEPVVVVDASFAHRIDPKEREQLEQAELHGEVVSPPAGAIGRGDAFVLRIAERTGAVVLSNDSFQEFHGEHPWLFDPGRLVGGKPVPGVGWIFTPRLPVRGAKSRKATKENTDGPPDDLSPPRKAAEVAKALLKEERAAKKASAKAKAPVDQDAEAVKPARKKKDSGKHKDDAKESRGGGRTTASGSKAAKPPATKKSAAKATAVAKPPARAKAAKAADGQGVAKRARAKATVIDQPPKAATRPKRAAAKDAANVARPARVRRAIDDATVEVLTADAPEEDKKRDAPRRGSGVPPPAVNDPLAFIRFVANHALGSDLEGSVVSFTSHGAMVDVELPESGVLHCYIPLRALGDPAPTKAREVLTRGQRRAFVLIGLDPPRRMAELALPEMSSKLLLSADGAADPARSPRRRSRVGEASSR
jgi:Zc3h12a-like Ribonuclease NYN domain